MRAWIVGIVAITMLTLGATASVGAASEEQLVVGADAEGNVVVKSLSDLNADHSTACTWDLITNACSTGNHAASFGFILHGFLLPTGTTIGDFQSNLVGSTTQQFQCTFTYLEGAPIPGTPGYNCRVSAGGAFPFQYSHDCYAYPAGALGTLVAEDPSTQGPGLPGWVNQPEDSTACINIDF